MPTTLNSVDIWSCVFFTQGYVDRLSPGLRIETRCEAPSFAIATVWQITDPTLETPSGHMAKDTVGDRVPQR